MVSGKSGAIGIVSNRMLVRFALALSGVLATGLTAADAPIDQLPAKPGGIGRPAAIRSAWDPLAATTEGAKLIRQAESYLKSAPVPFDSTLYQEYYTNGNRSRFQDHNSARWKRLRLLTLAECLEGRQRFVPALDATIQSLCSDPSWCLPAHDHGAWIFKGNKPYADLVVAASGFDLATVVHLLADRLPAATQTLARREIARRLTAPVLEQIRGEDPSFYQSRHWWSRANHNWNAVCTAGGVGAILLTEPSATDRADALRWARNNMKIFLSGFSADGYCSEGVGYWSYGFGHFTILSELVYQHTAGTDDWLATPRVREIAAATCGQEITHGFHPCFADAGMNSRPSALVVNHLAGCGIWPAPSAMSTIDVITRASNLYEAMLLGFPARSEKPATAGAAAVSLPPHHWLPDAGVYIGRPAVTGSLAVAWKGGSNDEHHNHNDVGSTMLYHRGQMLLCDPGAMVYTAETFGKDRYRFPVMSSYGHSTPVVDRQFQLPGKAARGKVLSTSFSDLTDRITIDLRSCYPVAGLSRLEREWTYQRGEAGALTLEDRFTCDRTIPFESALIGLGTWHQLAPDLLALSGPSQAAVTVKLTASHPTHLQLVSIENPGKPTVTRLGIRLQSPQASGWIRAEVAPATPAQLTNAKPLPIGATAPAKLPNEAAP